MDLTRTPARQNTGLLHRLGEAVATFWERAHGSLIAFSLSWGCTTVLVITFAVAALAPERQVTVTVDRYGEMAAEAAVLTIVWTLVTMGVLIGWRRVQSGRDPMPSCSCHKAQAAGGERPQRK